MTIKSLLTKKSAVITGAVAAAVMIAAVFIFRGCNDNNEIKASGNTAREEVSAVDKDNSAAADDKGLGNETAGTDKEKLENNDAAAVADTEVGSDTTASSMTSEGTANEGNRNGEQGGNSDSSYLSGNSGDSSSNGNQDTWQGGDSVAPGNESQNGEQSGDTVQGGVEDTAQGGEDDAPQELPDFPYECYVLTERLLHNIYGEPLYYVMGFYVLVDEYNSERASLMRSRLFERSEELYGKVIRSTGVNPVNEQGTPSGYTDYKTGRYYFVYVDHTDYDFEYKGY